MTELSVLADSVRPDPDSIARVASELFEALRVVGENAEDIPITEPLTLFANNVRRHAFDWMGTGELDQIEALSFNVARVIHAEHAAVRQARSVTPATRLVLELQAIANDLNVFLRGVSQAKFAGILSGRRKLSWRQALGALYKANAPMRVGELMERGVFKSDSTANDAMNHMAKARLVERVPSGSGVAFGLTWDGRAYCRQTLGVSPPIQPPTWFTASHVTAAGYTETFALEPSFS